MRNPLRADHAAHLILNVAFVLGGTVLLGHWGAPAVAALLIGAGRETAQYFGWMDGHGELSDMAANVAGVGLAVLWLAVFSGFPR